MGSNSHDAGPAAAIVESHLKNGVFAVHAKQLQLPRPTGLAVLAVEERPEFTPIYGVVGIDAVPP